MRGPRPRNSGTMDPTDTKAYGDSWYAATKVDAPHRPALAGDHDVEVCVIGGGLAGLTTAREVARSGWSVALLEASRLAASASGRNTGFVLPGFGADADRLIARVGFESTKSLWELSEAGLDYVRDVVAANAAAGIDPQPGWLYVSKVDNADEFLRYVQLLGDLGCEIESWPTERVRAVLHSERYFHAIHYLRAIAIHPLNYALALAAEAEADGARIFEDTPALSIDPAGVRKRIVTPNARLRANHVVLCGNVQIGSLAPRLGSTLLPITTYVITTEPLGSRLAKVIGFRGAVSDTDLADNHYRVVGGDRLMLSGRSTTWARNPRRYVGALTSDIKKTYPQLGDVAAEYAWSGTLGVTVHRMPQIGEFGPGVWLASGFGGHGLNTTAMAGNLIARAIVHGDQTWRQFSPFELVWAGSIGGRVVAQMRVRLKRWRDAFDERRSRARESAQRRSIEAQLVLEAERASRSTTDSHIATRPGAMLGLPRRDLAAQRLAPRVATPQDTPPQYTTPLETMARHTAHQDWAPPNTAMQNDVSLHAAHRDMAVPAAESENAATEVASRDVTPPEMALHDRARPDRLDVAGPPVDAAPPAAAPDSPATIAEPVASAGSIVQAPSRIDQPPTPNPPAGSRKRRRRKRQGEEPAKL
jgi:gamma-glutamylputrescine oxidase